MATTRIPSCPKGASSISIHPLRTWCILSHLMLLDPKRNLIHISAIRERTAHHLHLLAFIIHRMCMFRVPYHQLECITIILNILFTITLLTRPQRQLVQPLP